MFRRLKQKIESESEGEQSPVTKNERTPKRTVQSTQRIPIAKQADTVSSERDDTDVKVEENVSEHSSQHVIARVHQLLEAGRAQNGAATPQKAEELEKSPSIVQHVTTASSPTPPESPTKPDDKSDDRKYDVATKEELLTLAKKQEKALIRYKTKFSEVVDAYKNLQRENEKLQNNVGQSQDRQIRKIAELKETVELEKKAKMHMEDTLRISMEEKDDLIKVLKTQVNCLRNNKSTDSLDENSDQTDNKQVFKDEKTADKLRELEETIEEQAQEILRLKEKEQSSEHQAQAHAKNTARLQQERQTAIQEMMANVENIMEEKNDCEAKLSRLSEDFHVTKVLLEECQNQKEEIIQKMDKALEEHETSEKDKLAKLNDEHQSAIQSMITDHNAIVDELKRTKAEAIELVKQQQAKYTADVVAAKEEEHNLALEERQKQLDLLLSRKESDLKAAYSEKVKEVELAVEEKELQKHAVVKQKFDELSKLESRIAELENETKEKDVLLQELQASKLQLNEMQQRGKDDQDNMQLHQKELEEKIHKNEEHVHKLQEKINDLKKTAKKQEHALSEQMKLRKNEEEKHKKELQDTIRDLEAKKQGELAIVSKKSASKVTEMKNIVKQLRNKLAAQEEKTNEMEQAVQQSNKAREDLFRQVEERANENKKVVEWYTMDLKKKEDIITELNDQIEKNNQEQAGERRKMAEDEEKFNIKDEAFEQLSDDLERRVKLCSQLESDLHQMASDYEKNISELKDLHRNEIDELNEKFKNIINENRKKLEEEKNDEQMKIRKEAESRAKEMKQIINELRGSLKESELCEEEMKASVARERDSVNMMERQISEKDEFIRQLESSIQSYDGKVNELKSQIATLNQDREIAFKEKEAEKAEWMKDMENKMTEKLKEKDEFLSKTIEKLTKQNELTVDDIAHNYESIKEEQIKSLHEQHEAQLAEINSVHERAMAFSKKEAMESHERIITEAKDREEQLVRENQALNTQLKNKKDELDQSSEIFQEKLASSIDELKVKSEQIVELENLVEQRNNEIGQLKQSMDDKLMELVEKHRQDMNNSRQEFEQQIESISIEHSGAVEDLTNQINVMKNTFANDAETLRKDREAELFEIRNSYEAKQRDTLSKMENENTQLKEVLEKRQKEAEKDEVKKAESYRTLQMQYDQLVTQHKEICSEKTEVDDKLRIVTRKLDESLSSCTKVQQTLDLKEVENLEIIKALDDIKHNKQLIEDRLREREVEINVYEEKLAEVNSELVKEKERLTEELNSKCSALEEQLNKKNTELDEILRRIQSESQVEIEGLRETVSDLQVKINDMSTEHESDVEGFKKNIVQMKKKVKHLTEECKKKDAATNSLKDQYEKAILEMTQNEENLKLEVASSKHDSKTVDDQVKKLLQDKQDLQKQLNALEERHRHETQAAEQKLEEVVANYEQESFSKQEEMNSKILELERGKKESLGELKESLNAENKQKVLDLKKKAETKIAGLRKQLTKQLEERGEELAVAKNTIKRLEVQLQEQQALHSENVQRMAVEHEAIVKTKTNEVESQMGEIETNTKSLVEKIAQLEASEITLMETVENLRVQKMDALREQSLSLKEDHRLEVEKLESEHQKSTELLQKRLQAKVEEKDFEYNGKIKQVVKEFQAKLASKDQEIQDTLANTIESVHKEEKQLSAILEDEIVELKKELKYRDDEMMQLKNENEQRLMVKESEISNLIQDHERALKDSEIEYHNRIAELNAKHETEVKKLGNSEQLLEIERKYEAELARAQKGHSSELLALEKKLKHQMKKNQTDMKKLLNAKEAEFEKRSSPIAQGNNDVEESTDNVDVLKATIERLNREMDLLREREALLKSETEPRVENGLATPQRPNELHLTSNPFSSPVLGSPSSHPGETEYEYLRNILFQYMMGKQRKQLSKVLATLVRFTPSQFQQVVQKEDEREAAKGGFFSPLRS